MRFIYLYLYLQFHPTNFGLFNRRIVSNTIDKTCLHIVKVSLSEYTTQTWIVCFDRFTFINAIFGTKFVEFQMIRWMSSLFSAYSVQMLTRCFVYLSFDVCVSVCVCVFLFVLEVLLLIFKSIVSFCIEFHSQFRCFLLSFIWRFGRSNILSDGFENIEIEFRKKKKIKYTRNGFCWCSLLTRAEMECIMAIKIHRYYHLLRCHWQFIFRSIEYRISNIIHNIWWNE